MWCPSGAVVPELAVAAAEPQRVAMRETIEQEARPEQRLKVSDLAYLFDRLRFQVNLRSTQVLLLLP